MYPYVILVLSIIFWIFPAIRNWSGEYKYLFLTLAMADPINAVFLLLRFNWNPDFIAVSNGCTLAMADSSSKIFYLLMSNYNPNFIPVLNSYCIILFLQKQTTPY